MTRRIWIVLAFLTFVLGCVGLVWFYTYRAALEQLARQGQTDLSLASDRVMSQLARYRELAVFMVDHPAFRAATDQTSRALLLSAADKTAAYDLVYADQRGRVRATAHGKFGQDVSQDPVFARAMQGALGSGHRVMPDGGPRVFVFAAPDFAPDGRVEGAMLVAVEIETIEWGWRGSNPVTYFTDANNQVFISNRSEILSWNERGDAGGQARQGSEFAPAQVQLQNGLEVWDLQWGRYWPQRALHLTQPLPVIGMTGEVLVDIASARRLALLQAAVVGAMLLAFGAVLYQTADRRRALAQANAELEARVTERTAALLETNTTLRKEVAERHAAEAALKRAQDDLVQASKLSALGQMSAGISHELNQPLMAIRSFAENGAEFMARGKHELAAGNLTRISDLARRMGRIIQNLRAFARQDKIEAGQSDLVQVLGAVLDLTGPQLRKEGVTLTYVPPSSPLWVRGGEVRLSQVFVNLVTNAVDAMAGGDRRDLTIRITGDDPATIVIEDTGSGIDAPDKVFEPFYSTKEVGASEGMGLGLSISYGIVQSCGGSIHGENRSGGGARFTVKLVAVTEAEDAA
jgi:two-component system C4-dicarboxylate transport sensor histidine kinase DctB